jgi:predicted dehydrogenase
MLSHESAPPTGAVKTSAPIRIGVVGCGYWGPKLARNFNELPDTTLAAVCDFRPDRLAHMHSLYPACEITDSYTDMLKMDLEAVVIATPVKLHHPLARAALEAGKHVLVEKPITASAAHAQDLISLAEEKARALMVGHTFEYNAAVEAVKRVIDAGELGSIYYINCTRVNLGLFQPDINVIWDLAPHDISIVNYLLGQTPATVSAKGGTYVRPNSALHEIAYLTLVYPNCVMATLRLSWLDPVKMRQIVIIGSKKMLVYDDIADDKVVLYDKGTEQPPYSDTEQEFRMSYRDNGKTVVPVEWVEPLRRECQHFADSIRQKTAPRSCGQVGLQVVQTLEAAQKSILHDGLWVPCCL